MGETGISDLAADVSKAVRRRETLGFGAEERGRGLVRDKTELEPARRSAVACGETD